MRQPSSVHLRRVAKEAKERPVSSVQITVVQSSLHWEDPVRNIRHFNKLLSTIKKGETDLIVLPEMFSTGFSMIPGKHAEEMEGLSMQWMAETAAALKCVITGSLMMREKGKYYNRLIWMRPDGTYEYYNKRHLFRMAGEDRHYEAGKKKLIVDLKGWKVCPLICYDLRFPVWSRNHMTAKGKEQLFDYDVLLFVANWPAVRRFPWQQLLIARAIENQCYVAGVNRVGKDGNGFPHCGDSVVLNPRGEKLSAIKANATQLQTITLERKELDEFRKKFPVFMDAD